MKKVFTSVLIASLLLISLTVGGCTSQKGEGFAIYLTEQDIPVSQMEALSHVEIADEPVISMSDIVSYDWNTHEIELTAEAYERVNSFTIPTSGKSFVVCIDRNPIYWGAFWTPISSQSFDGVTIWVPSFSEKENTIKLELGYPSAGFYSGEDPRSNPEILQSLEQAGKLN
jgi:hypothetical protein